MLALFSLAVPGFGGGVRLVAGQAFDASVRGRPLRWESGALHYYTDPGKLGSLTHAEADALLADAFSRWSGVATAAISATRDGDLDEDVNGGNVFFAAGDLVLPADIRPSALAKPVAIVYDDDGGVIDALLGNGASDPSLCLANGVIGGPDAHDRFAHYQHALLILNGRCVSAPSDLLRLRYLLLRVIGLTFGLGWSQLNDNVATSNPFPTQLDIAGVPLMHPVPVLCGAAFPNCSLDADRLRMDDRAAISDLYPITAADLAAFPGKQVFSATTARISGTLRFAVPNGSPGQPMQGVNVIARLVDPQTGIASRVLARSSVSGFRFRGNAGNSVTGTLTPLGVPYADFGGVDPALEGEFDLSGLELPEGSDSAQYRLEFESINPLYIGDHTVGPYSDAIVGAAGTFSPLIITVMRGGSVERMISPFESTMLAQDRLEPSGWLTSRPIAAGGGWAGSISGYADEDFFRFTARAGRTFAVEASAVDAGGAATIRKLMPVIGVWQANAAADSGPLVSAGPFNGTTPGTTVLQASANATGDLKVGIMDFRGDGRPDFLYRARLLYIDTVVPAQVAPDQSARIVLLGTGFRHGMIVRIGGVPANVIHLRENEIGVLAPALSLGIYDVVVEDPISGTVASVTQGLRYGAASGDQITDLSIGNLSVPVGTVAPNPVRVRVTDVTGQPLAGELVTFIITPSPSQLSCNSSTCGVLTDANGEAAIHAVVNFAGSSAVTAQISNGASIIRGVTGTVLGAQLLALTPFVFVAAGDTVALPAAFRYSISANPVAGVTVNAATIGAGASLTNAAPVTDASGVANTTLNLSNAAATINVTACVTATSACAQFSVLPQLATNLQLVPVTSLAQQVGVGDPVTVRFRITGAAPAFVPITQAKVAYSILVSAAARSRSCSEDSACAPGDIRVLANIAGTVISDATGLIELRPEVDPAWGAVHISVRATLGSGAQQSAEINVVPMSP